MDIEVDGKNDYLSEIRVGNRKGRKKRDEVRLEKKRENKNLR